MAQHLTRSHMRWVAMRVKWDNKRDLHRGKKRLIKNSQIGLTWFSKDAYLSQDKPDKPVAMYRRGIGGLQSGEPA